MTTRTDHPDEHQQRHDHSRDHSHDRGRRRPARRWWAALGVGALAGATLVATPAAAVEPAGTTSPDPSLGRGALTAVAQAADRPLLRLGDSGPSVAAWQRQLTILTSDDDFVEIDGVYSASTARATEGFQRFFGLRVDGIVGENTRDVMRYLLAVSRDYTTLFTYEDVRIVGYTSSGNYCFEVQSGDEFSTECSTFSGGPLDGAAIAVEGTEPQLVGTVEPVIGEVEVETAEGTVPADVQRDVPGLDGAAWSTALPPSAVVAVRALANDGSEVRRLVVDDGTAYLILEQGDRGPSVAAWQDDLNTLTGAGLAVDGVFGPRTVEATENFQRFLGLRVDGIVGPQSRDVMAFLLAYIGAA